MVDYYNISGSEAIKLLKSSEKGLTKNEAEKRLEEFGYNELQKEKRLTTLTLFISQFKNALILLLIFAGFLSLFLGERIESIAIFGIVFLNAILGFIQEYKAEKAIEALEKISAPTAKVLRDGEEQKIPAREVVPGDILLLEAGDIVPADSRLLEISSLQIDEASLTGESVPSKK
ncbi:HAD-IC family P-type ATPase [Candidatus Woesearchaeota archaeon]|nr:HAD-IC family P-type ATPase [Candidatus Woesearchaeota archaeon]